ncbi:MAG TPA: hypothetical protein VES89_02965 [Candidatus Competibacteraceae bacterium]|nr:hypothetical protein [Candidatus Competibacteraceae bacterium]
MQPTVFIGSLVQEHMINDIQAPGTEPADVMPGLTDWYFQSRIDGYSNPDRRAIMTKQTPSRSVITAAEMRIVFGEAFMLNNTKQCAFKSG